jgi:hypothetical protein
VPVDEQEPDIRRERRTSGQLTVKFISIEGAKRRFGDRAQKAAGLTPGDLLRVASATEAVERQPDRRPESETHRDKVGPWALQLAQWPYSHYEKLLHGGLGEACTHNRNVRNRQV